LSSTPSVVALVLVLVLSSSKRLSVDYGTQVQARLHHLPVAPGLDCCRRAVQLRSLDPLAP
jgi:hypothetical protein